MALYTLADAAPLTRLDVSTLRRRCAAGRIPGAELHGKTWLIPEESLVEIQRERGLRAREAPRLQFDPPRLRPAPWALDGAPAFVSRSGRMWFQYSTGGGNLGPRRGSLGVRVPQECCAGCGQVIEPGSTAFEALPLSWGDRPSVNTEHWHGGCVEVEDAGLSAGVDDYYALLHRLWRFSPDESASQPPAGGA
jgi:hypothetical protein